MLNFLSKSAKNIKIQLIALLLVLTVGALFQQSGGQVKIMVLQLATTIVVALLAEYAFFGVVKKSAVYSAIITGFIIGLLLAPGIDLQLLWFAVVVAIASKTLLRFPKGSHIFNPAAFGLLITTLFFGNKINWWGFSHPYIIIILAGIMIYRFNRLSLAFSYIFFRCLGVILLSAFSFNIEILLLPNLFFAFIMLVEPKTTPAKRPQQWLFGAGTGLLASLLFSIIPAFGGDLIALLLMNFIGPLLYRKQ